MISLVNEHKSNKTDKNISSDKDQSDSCISPSSEKKHSRKLPLWMVTLSQSINSSTSDQHKKIKQSEDTYVGNGQEQKKKKGTDYGILEDRGISSTINLKRNLENAGCSKEKTDTHAISDSDNSDKDYDSSIVNKIKYSGPKFEHNDMEISNNQSVVGTSNKGVPCNEVPLSVKPDIDQRSVNIHLKVGAQHINQDDKTSANTQDGDGGHGSKSIQRQLCKYGNKCYRKSHEHLKHFSHPGEKDYDDALSKDTLPECEYGTSCYRKNPLHRQHYQHTKRYRKTLSKRPLKDSGSSEDDYMFLNDGSSDDYDPTDSDADFSDSDSDMEAANENQGSKRVKKDVKQSLKKK